MKRYKRFNESYSTKEIDYHLFDAIDEFSQIHDIDFYMSGGCYEFAYALILTLEHFKQKYQPWTMGQDIHMVIEFNKQFWDISNSHKRLSDKEYDFYTSEGEDREWHKINRNYVKASLHSTNLKNASENAQELIDYIEGKL
jgi:hypothetical protein